MTNPPDSRRRHPAARRPGRPTETPAWVAGVTTAGCLLAVTAGLAEWGRGADRTQETVLLVYGAALALLGGAVAVHLARRRALLRASTDRAMALALEREERLHLIVSSLQEGLIFQDRDLRVVEFNDAASRILGIGEGAIGRRPQDIAPWTPLAEDGTELTFDEHPAARALRTGEPVLEMTMGVAIASAVIWVKLNAIPVSGEDGEPEGVLTTFHDVTAARTTSAALASTEAAATHAAAALSWQALHDPLTELANRAQMVEQLTVALEEAQSTGAVTAVLSLDLDRFQQINETMGHEAGDRVLVEVANRLRSVLRPGHLAARVGGDEFLVLAEGLADRSEAVQVAETLRQALGHPIWLPQGNVTITASIGIAFDADHRPSSLLRDADTALHKAKDHGRDRHAIFDDSLRAEAIRRAAAEQILRKALDEDGLRVIYQPIADLRSGAVIGAEALLRVMGPHGELLTPASFITIAEETGLIVPIGAGVLDTACAQLRTWRDELGGDAPSFVSVNLSARQITTRSFAPMVGAALDRHGLDPAWLTLELTETTLIEASQDARDTIEELDELGVRLAIDDFGTGYSSLAYLRRFPVDVVKIDRSFVDGLGVHQHDTEIVRAVLALAQSLGLVAVAEGVETDEQLAALRDLGCDRAQGYLLARPGRPEELATAAPAIRDRIRALDQPARHIRIVAD